MELPSALPSALPFEILLEIALSHPRAWRVMVVAVPAIGWWSLTHKEEAANRLTRMTMREPVMWRLPNGMYHSPDDEPAYVCEHNNDKMWYKWGKEHRDGDKPAFYSYDHQAWYIRGKRHRDGDLPASLSFGRFYWFGWYKDGNKHRDGAPATISNSRIMWYKNGKKHREDGPAKVTIKGRTKWYRDGVKYVGLPHLTNEERKEYGRTLWHEHKATFVQPQRYTE